MLKLQFPRMFSTDSAKAEKAKEFGWLNMINYLAPHKSGALPGEKPFNLCGNASAACIMYCLGRESGQAAMVSHATGTNSVRDSRERKARYFMRDRIRFLQECSIHIARGFATAHAAAMQICVRMNGSADIPYEGLRFPVSAELATYLCSVMWPRQDCAAQIAYMTGNHTIYSLFWSVQFVDYTKNPRRFDKPLPANLDLTFSRSEENESVALELLRRGVNVAVIFAGEFPATWNGFRVIDGDKHDLRHLDEKGGLVVGLSPKGNKIKKDSLGFVLRDYAMAA